MRLIDSHTGGEPTRVIVEGGPDLGAGTMASRLKVLAEKFDHVRTAVVLEPRGSDHAVGALLTEASNSDCVTGVIFFNNAGYLGMCGHGTIGVAVTLFHLGIIGLGEHNVETPVGVVRVDLQEPNVASFENVPSYCYRTGVTVDVDKLGPVSGSIAWGGNWFFLVDNSPVELSLANIAALRASALNVQQALSDAGVTGEDGATIDHVEFFGPAQTAGANSRNFVLCPGGEYDRSPCGTGTSAKIACLAAAGKLQPGDEWVQESVIGSRFTASYRVDDNSRIVPRITGHAYVCGDTRLVQQADDPYVHGIV